MKNKKEKIEIAKDVFVLIIIAIISSASILVNPISSLDEIWNFNFARNVANGLIPYKDFNIITTPLLSIICGIFLAIFGKELFIMRIIAIILMCLIFFTAYKILKKITNINYAIFIITIMVSIFIKNMCIDYNYAVLLISLLLMYIEIKSRNENLFNYKFKYNFLLGILAGVAVLFKQTTGIAVMLACCGYKIFEIRKREEIRNFIKIAFTRFLGSIIPITLFVTYLLINDAFMNFIDYAILGIKTFSNVREYKELLQYGAISILAVVVPIFLIISFIRLFKKEINEEQCIIFAYSISTFVVVFPISDLIHFFIGSLVSLIGLAYYLYKFLMKLIKSTKNKKFNYMLGITLEYAMFTIGILCISFYSIGQYVNSQKETELLHFKYISKNETSDERIKIIDNYILEQENLGKTVYILDSEAAIYNIPLDKYNKDYDLFLRGNLGSKGEEGIIERIKEEENAIYLVKNICINWQHPVKVTEYVRDNLKHKGEISIFSIYEK